MPRTPASVAGALDLRAWALAALSAPGAPLAPPAAGAEAWERFLRVEQCALAISSRAGGVLGGAAAGAVARRARSESLRVLSARAQLRRLDVLVREHGLAVVVLKGGVPLMRGAPGVNLMDLDLLALPDAAAALGAALDAAGHRAHGGAASHRLAIRAAPNDLPLELHTAIPGIATEAAWRRLGPAPAPGLHLLHPADHLLYLLLHSAVQHADRRGRLRDLLLVEDALAACEPRHLAEVREAIARDPHAEVLAAQLEMAGWMARRGGAGRDPFELTAAGTYLLDAVLERRSMGPTLRGLAWQAGTAAVARRAGMPSALGEHGLALPSAVPGLVAIRRFAPPLERALRRAVRRAREWALFPLAFTVAAGAARAVRERAGRNGPAA